MSAPSRPDRALGVFETVLARDQRVQALELHLERLGTAVADLYGERLPSDLGERVRATVAPLTGVHRVRVDAIPGAGALQITVAATPIDARAPTEVVTLEPVLVPGGIGPYKWRDRRLLDGLMGDSSIPLILDVGEELLETARTNVWILEGRRIVTPPADGRLLPGVTRARLLGLAETLGLEAAAERVTLARAAGADALFLTSSIRLAAGARLIDGTGPAPDIGTVATVRAAVSEAGWSG